MTEGTTEYYDKKIEKCLENSGIKQLIIGSEHHLLQSGRKMIENDDNFKEESIKITQDLFDLCTKIEEMPNANLMFVECKVDGKKYILIIKLNYKTMPMSLIEENNCESADFTK